MLRRSKFHFDEGKINIIIDEMLKRGIFVDAEAFFGHRKYKTFSSRDIYCYAKRNVGNIRKGISYQLVMNKCKSLHVAMKKVTIRK